MIGPPRSHLALVAVVVDDYDQAIRFFVDALGFELPPRFRYDTGQGSAPPAAGGPGPGAPRPYPSSRGGSPNSSNRQLDGYAGRRSTETPVIVLEPLDGTA